MTIIKKHSFWFPLSIITLLVMAFMSNDLFIPSMPELTGHFHTSANSIQQAIALWFYGAMALQMILGPLSDQYGRKPILLVSTGILVLASLVCAMANDLTSFLIGRFFQGLGVSGIMVSAFAALHEVYEKQNNGTKILGYVGFCTALSPLAGPLIGGYAAAFWGWEINFYAVSGMGLVLMLLLYNQMPETLERSKKANWKEFGKGYARLLKNLTFTTTIASYGLLFLAGGAFLAVAPFVVTDLLSLPVTYVGYAMMPLFILYMLASGFAGKLESKIAPHTLIGTSFILLTILMLIFMYGAELYEHSSFFILLGFGGYYLGLGLIGPPLNNISLSQASSEEKGCASALLTVTMMVGSALGASSMSLWYNGRLFPVAIIMGLSALAAFGLFMVHFIWSGSTEKSMLKGQETN